MKLHLKKMTYVLTSSLLLCNANASYSQSLATTPFWQYQAGWTPPPPAGYNNSTQAPNQDIVSILERIRVYIRRLGLYMGFDLESNQPPNAYNALVNTSNTTLIQSSIVKNYFSILSSNLYYPLVVPTDSTYKELNSLLSTVFSLVAPTNLIDSTMTPNNTSDQNPPPSPATQAVLNILSYTPEGFCISGSVGTSTWIQNCPYQYTPAFIMGTALGMKMGNDILSPSSPSTGGAAYLNSLSENINNGSAINLSNWYPAATGDRNQSPQQNLLNQLDSSVFLTPLVYSKSNSQQNQNTNSKPGAPTSLTVQNQIQAAQDFLRYLTGSILPPTLPTKAVFDSLIQKISTTKDQQQQINSFDSLTSYLLGVRVFAARQSVAIQNIYEMLSKRIPQDSRDQTLTRSATSQAMDEFIMASYRLFTPNAQPNSGGSPSPSAWQTKISGASSATVEKEMVILLAEINYQLYQMRQQQERMLLTQSLIMMNGNNYPLLQDND